jgi:hypothetical protein
MLTLRLTLTIPAIPILQPEQATTIIRREVGTAMHGIVEDIASQARTRTPVGATGILRASIATRVSTPLETSTAIRGEVFTGAQAPYAVYVESGTRPHFPPIAPLRLWAARVLGNERLAYVVARAIARRGTRARRMFAQALDAVRPTIQPRLQTAVDRIAQLLGGR